MLRSICVLFSCLTVLCSGYPDPGSACGLNEESKCIQDCPPQKTCKNLEIQYSCLQWFKPCSTVCVCKDGLVRNESGACVPVDQCPPNPSREKRAVCGQNERMRCEFPHCPTERTCRNRNQQLFCPDVLEDCKDRCVCDDGYYRNSGGICVTKEECDQCRGDHEYFACGSECDNECSTLHVQNKTSCPIVNIVCNKKCYCEDNFARDNKGTCIPIQKCRK